MVLIPNRLVDRIADNRFVSKALDKSFDISSKIENAANVACRKAGAAYKEATGCLQKHPYLALGVSLASFGLAALVWNNADLVREVAYTGEITGIHEILGGGVSEYQWHVECEDGVTRYIHSYSTDEYKMGETVTNSALVWDFTKEQIAKVAGYISLGWLGLKTAKDSAVGFLNKKTEPDA